MNIFTRTKPVEVDHIYSVAGHVYREQQDRIQALKAIRPDKSWEEMREKVLSSRYKEVDTIKEEGEEDRFSNFDRWLKEHVEKVRTLTKGEEKSRWS